MKLVHISDLHIGKRLSEHSLDGDQRHILNSIIGIVRDLKPAGVLIAGDVYDSGVPDNDSYGILNSFLEDLSSTGAEVFMIAGNHDSRQKLAYCGGFLNAHGIHIVTSYDGELDVRILESDGEKVAIAMLPFIRPSTVRGHHPDAKTYDDAVRSVLDGAILPEGMKRIIVSHQFVTSSDRETVRSDSELSIGGVENVDYSAYDSFDYVALGHIHTPQWVGRKAVRYCGSPLKYSKSEYRMPKTVTVVETIPDIEVSEIPLVPLRDVRVVRGPLQGLIEAGKAQRDHCDDFVFAELTEPSIDAMNRLREVYPNIAGMCEISPEDDADIVFCPMGFDESTDITQEFMEFYKHKTKTELTLEQLEVLIECIEEVGL